MPLPEMTFSPEDTGTLRAALGRFATGVTVVTTQAENGPQGITANSFASVSLAPPLVLWSPARASTRFGYFADARHFAIHILSEDQAGLAARFTRGGTGFNGLAHDLSPEGIPLITGVLARFECETHATHAGGDHLIVVGRVIRAALRTGEPLVFSQGTYGRFDALG